MTYGHLCGDSVLSDVAAAIKGNVQRSDLVGRIGGDEFLVYLPEVANELTVRDKCEKIIEALSCIRPEPGAHSITCSIGVAVKPHSQSDYGLLYQTADIALYRRKNSGRDGFTFYELEMKESIGRSFDVSRAYIFESSEDGCFCSNTFEWCGDGVTSQISTLQNIAYVDELGDYLKNFNENGIFYCHDIDNLHPDVYAVLKPQGIRSMLQCAMLDECEFVGYVGFDECRENRAWSERQVAAFKLTADVLSTFLVKLRVKQKEKII